MPVADSQHRVQMPLHRFIDNRPLLQRLILGKRLPLQTGGHRMKGDAQGVLGCEERVFRVALQVIANVDARQRTGHCLRWFRHLPSPARQGKQIRMGRQAVELQQPHRGPGQLLAVAVVGLTVKCQSPALGPQRVGQQRRQLRIIGADAGQRHLLRQLFDAAVGGDQQEGRHRQHRHLGAVDPGADAEVTAAQEGHPGVQIAEHVQPLFRQPQLATGL